MYTEKQDTPTFCGCALPRTCIQLHVLVLCCAVDALLRSSYSTNTQYILLKNFSCEALPIRGGVWGICFRFYGMRSVAVAATTTMLLAL